MIHPSRRYRFIQELEDKGFYEIDLIQHQATDYRAVRRAFTEKFSRDRRAVDAVTEQMRLAARCNAPALPTIFSIEHVENRLCIVYELVEGMPIQEFFGKKAYTKARPWGAFALQLVRELTLIRKAGGRLEKLPYHHLAMTETGEMRFVSRSPVGRLTKEQAASSEFLERFHALPGGGIYTSEDPPRESEELLAIREIFTRAASGGLNRSTEDLRGEVERSPTMYSSKLAMIEAEPAEIITSMATPLGDGRISTLPDLLRVLEKYVAERDAEVAQSMSTSTAFLHSTPQATPTSSSTPYPQAASSSPATQVPSSSATAFPSDDVGSPYSTPPPPVAPPPSGARVPASERGPVAKQPVDDVSIPEDMNPFASNEEIQKVVTSQPVALQAVKGPVRKKGSKKGLLIGVGAIAVAGCVAAAVLLMPTSKPNEKPVATVRDIASSYPLNGQVPLDASGSSDPEGAQLRYHWRLLKPEKTTVIFTEIGTGKYQEGDIYTTTEPQLRVQVFTKGPTQFQLRVNDGSFFSEPVVVETNVE